MHLLFTCSACLRSWLEQDTSCPTCRNSLSDLHVNQDAMPVHDANIPGHNEQIPEQHVGLRQRTTNRFHFDGISLFNTLTSCILPLVAAFAPFIHTMQILSTCLTALLLAM